MNILATHRELDIAGYHMLEQLSYKPDINIFITAADENTKIRAKCISIKIAALNSKISWKAIRDIRKAIKKHDIDLIFSVGSSGLSNALFASLGTKAQNIAYRGTQKRIRRSDITYYLGILNPRVKHIICLTPDIKEYLSKFIRPERLTINPKPFDVSWVEKACLQPKQVEEIPENVFKVIYIAHTQGRPYKGLSFLIEAIQLLDNPNLHFIFIGNYDKKDYQLSQKGENGKNMHFLGEREDALYFLPKQNLFVLPSLRDAYPRSVKEAMACGLPCIVSDIVGARDLVVNKETGLLAPAGNPEKLAEAIRWFMENEEQCRNFGNAGREHIITHFSVEKFIDTFEKVFRLVYNQKHKAPSNSPEGGEPKLM